MVHQMMMLPSSVSFVCLEIRCDLRKQVQVKRMKQFVSERLDTAMEPLFESKMKVHVFGVDLFCSVQMRLHILFELARVLIVIGAMPAEHLHGFVHELLRFLLSLQLLHQQRGVEIGPNIGVIQIRGSLQIKQ